MTVYFVIVAQLIRPMRVHGTMEDYNNCFTP